MGARELPFSAHRASSEPSGQLSRKQIRLKRRKKVWQDINNHYSIQVAIAALYKKMWWRGTVGYNCGKSFWWRRHQTHNDHRQRWSARGLRKTNIEIQAVQLKAGRTRSLSFFKNYHIEESIFVVKRYVCQCFGWNGCHSLSILPL